MKSLILAIVLSFSATAFAANSYSVEASEELSILSRIVGVQSTYSQASGLEARVFEVLAGDGMNAVRMAVVFSDGMGSSYGFMLDEMVRKVTRITFLAIDTVVVNYVQETFDANDNVIEVKRSVTIKVDRFSDGSIADSITVSN